MANALRAGLVALLLPSLCLVGCGGDDSSSGAGGSSGNTQGGAGGFLTAGSGAGGNASAGSNFGGSAGVGNGGTGGLPTSCDFPLSGEMREIAPLAEFASFEYFSDSSCRITGQTSAVGPFSVFRGTSTSGQYHLYSADAFTWDWVSYSEGELVSEAEIRPLPEDTNISVTLSEKADPQHEVDVVFRLSGTQFTVLSLVERN
ncbi:MAG: hypothetical protein H6718_03845 [Polyangiaceae bacterium]|nr:hypothetical protein [Polyangiaceae bacterium]MCB9609343.1 hypothetical protein [Polyangiaceae bacterium]